MTDKAITVRFLDKSYQDNYRVFYARVLSQPYISKIDGLEYRKVAIHGFKDHTKSGNKLVREHFPVDVKEYGLLVSIELLEGWDDRQSD